MSQQIVWKDAMIFTAAGDLIRNGAVLVEDGRIQEVGLEVSVRQDAEIRSLAGRFLMPGFIDAHTHLTLWAPSEREELQLETPFYGVRTARDMLSCGVTTVRDVGGNNHFDIALRNAIAKGEVVGPRMLVAGKFIAPTGGHVHYWARCADGPEEVRKAVREQLIAGVDLIKIMVSGGAANAGENPDRMNMTKSEIQAAVEEATEAGKQVSAHAHPGKAIRACAEAGVHSVEHGKGLDEETIQSVIENDMWIVPTQAVYGRMATKAQTLGGEVAEIARKVYEEKTPNLREAVSSGVKIGVGTDCGRHYPHNDFVGEMLELEKVGMSNEEILIASTKQNAVLCGLEQTIGTIEAGKVADMVVIDGNPLETLSDASNVVYVIQGGVEVSRSDITHMGDVLPVN